MDENERCGCGLEKGHPGRFSQCRLIYHNGQQIDPKDNKPTLAAYRDLIEQALREWCDLHRRNDAPEYNYHKWSEPTKAKWDLYKGLQAKAKALVALHPNLPTLIDQVKNHAAEHYGDGGWDVIVECWEDLDIAFAIDGCKTLEDAIQVLSAPVDVWKDRQADAINSAF
jgi:hypothetical protein